MTMKSDLLEVTRSAATHEPAQIRTWSDGDRLSRADAAMVPALEVATVDAVFEEESLCFINESMTEPSRDVKRLSSQLTVLEAQCLKLRELLELAGVGRHLK
jgi:hypothetical protein